MNEKRRPEEDPKWARANVVRFLHQLGPYRSALASTGNYDKCDKAKKRCAWRERERGR